MNETLYVLDDEKDIVELVLLHLKKNGFDAHGFSRPSALLKAMEEELPALIILDLMLPEKDGLDLCRDLKKNEKYRSVPIVMLTAKQDETDKVLGLDLGADDYVTKPFSPKELVARVRAVLRRAAGVGVDEIIRLGDRLVIDLGRHEVRDSREERIDLTHTEFRILAGLAARKGWVFTREKLLSMIWGEAVYVGERNIDVHIRHLREKLGPAGKLILNIRGVGYKIAE